MPLLKVSLELVTPDGLEKLEWWSYLAEKKSLVISLAVWTQQTNVTDGHRPMACRPTALTHSVAQ